MSIDWRNYPHILALVGELQKWKEEFRIVEFNPADESGYDATGRIQRASDQSTYEVEEGFCWTHFMADGEWIHSGVKTGDWGLVESMAGLSARLNLTHNR